ncbi:MAG TPA: universal stress protein [Myxococcota bacterium]|nr:universal stress protein [Myxococcota bacterium]
MPVFQKIVVPLDFSDHSARALEMAIDIAKQSGGTLHLVHSYPINPILLSPYGVAIPPDLERGFREATDRQLREWAERASKVGVDVEIFTSSDAPSEAIVHHAEEIHADLIVMGTRGLTGLKHVVLGSVAERTLRHAPCPVLTLRAA